MKLFKKGARCIWHRWTSAIKPDVTVEITPETNLPASHRVKASHQCFVGNPSSCLIIFSTTGVSTKGGSTGYSAGQHSLCRFRLIPFPDGLSNTHSGTTHPFPIGTACIWQLKLTLGGLFLAKGRFQLDICRNIHCSAFRCATSCFTPGVLNDRLCTLDESTCRLISLPFS